MCFLDLILVEALGMLLVILVILVICPQENLQIFRNQLIPTGLSQQQHLCI